MFIETYQPMDSIEKFDVADGAHVVQIVNAQRTWTKDKSKQMILVDLRVEGQRNQANYQFRIVEGESFGMIMTNFFKMFGIQLGNFNFVSCSICGLWPTSNTGGGLTTAVKSNLASL